MNASPLNIVQVSTACQSLENFFLYIFSIPPFTRQFHGQLGTGQAALALKELGKRLNSLDTISALLPSAMRVFGQTIALGSTWGIEDWDTSAIPKITFSNWWLDGVERRRNRARDWHYWGGFRSRQDAIYVYTLDYRKALEKEKAWGNKDFEDQGSHNNGSTAKDDKGGHSWLDYDFGNTGPDNRLFKGEEFEDGQSDDRISSDDTSGNNGFK
ncbi:hypothetical protein ABVK25_008577 [Lepraria finkii]|uniref:Uncharacterized protein n=1 Tax=Lepraria finkii TaxID=1340010 RepID=A0ABR4AZS7_9LECA